jgi:hypothetical protein
MIELVEGKTCTGTSQLLLLPFRVLTSPRNATEPGHRRVSSAMIRSKRSISCSNSRMCSWS